MPRVSEYLMREAGKRGLSGSIVRPGYILGDSKNGYSITDDFLIRMLVGCVCYRPWYISDMVTDV